MGKLNISGELDINSYLSSAATFYISSANSTSIIFRNGTTEAARINPSGCLNIGSSQTSADYKLYVNGTSCFSGNIRPSGSNVSSCGISSAPWYAINSRRFYLYDGTNTSTTYGYMSVSTQGTTSTGGVTTLTLGNNLATGTAGNAYGRILLYSSSTGYAYLQSTSGTTSGTTHYLPSTGGTLLNTSNYSSYALPLSGGLLTASSGDTPLIIQPSSDKTASYIGFRDGSAQVLGYYGVNSSKQPIFYDTDARVILHAGNYTSYTVTKTGSGASGTWGISISGNAASTNYIKDATTSTAIYLNYGATGITSASWMAAWNGYELRAMSPDYVCASRLYSTDNAYKYSSSNGYYGYLTWNSPYWDFKVSPASPADVRVSKAYSADSATYAGAVRYQNAVITYGPGVGNTAGWYRFYQMGLSNAQSPTAILHISRSYNSPENEGYIFAITVGYAGHVQITQLSGYVGGHLSPKIRVDYVNSGVAYVDIYINTQSYNNIYYFYGSGYGTFLTPYYVASASGSTYEFTTVTGFKCDREIVTTQYGGTLPSSGYTGQIFYKT